MRIPTEGGHRGVPIHEGQSPERLRIVHRDIDAVHALRELDELVAFADDPANAPEARLYARAKALSLLDDAIERRAPRARTTVLSRERIQASAAGCDSAHWRSPTHYCSLLDPAGKPGQDRRERREVPLI